jgi:tetratricopeptide (TPR) repeat protein
MLPLLLWALTAATDPEILSARLHLEAGNALMGQGLLTQARDEFTTALDINPGENYAALGLARVAALQGSVPLASYWYRLFMERCSDDSRAPLELGTLLLGLPESLSASGELIRLAESMSPSDPEVRFAVAELLMAEGDTTATLLELEPLACRENPCQVEAGLLLASLLAGKGMTGAARAILSAPPFQNLPEALFLAARTHLVEGDYLRTADCLHRCLALSPPSGLEMTAARLLDSLAMEGLYIPR